MKNTFASRLVFSTAVAPVVIARVGDGRMEDECDDDPFDDPFGDALHVSSGLQTTRDSSAIDEESVGGENAVKGVVERVDVRIRGEFLRYKDAREVAVCITLSKPPPVRSTCRP